jgi:hypothetical protein
MKIITSDFNKTSKRALNRAGHGENKVLDFLKEVEAWYGVELG